MRPTRDLRRLRRAALARVDRLSGFVLDAATTPAENPRRDQLTAYSVVELYNGWYGFSRSLFVSVCLGARDITGSRVSLANAARSATTQDALTHAVRRFNPKRYKNGSPPWKWSDEPAWADSAVLLHALDQVGASNYSVVSAALSQPGASPVLAHLPAFRHFYAHRGEATRVRASGHALSYALSPLLSPTELLNSHGALEGVTRPQPVLMDWIDDVRAIVGSAI